MVVEQLDFEEMYRSYSEEANRLSSKDAAENTFIWIYNRDKKFKENSRKTKSDVFYMFLRQCKDRTFRTISDF